MSKPSTLLILVLLLVGVGVARLFEKKPSGPLPILGDVGAFHLSDEKGQPFTESSLDGHGTILDFFFTRCQGPCPKMTARMADLQAKTKPDIHLVSISMDPTYDTPQVLKEYGASFSANPERWHFLTGEGKTIVSLALDTFHLAAGGEAELHSTRFVLVDNQRKIRGYYDSTDEEAMVRLIKDAEAL